MHYGWHGRSYSPAFSCAALLHRTVLPHQSLVPLVQAGSEMGELFLLLWTPTPA